METKEFKIGSWYQWNNDSNIYYLRCLYLRNDCFYYDKYIEVNTNKMVDCNKQFYSIEDKNLKQEIPLSEIKQYLPKDYKYEDNDNLIIDNYEIY